MVDDGGLVSFQVQIAETDLHILAKIDLQKRAAELVRQYRNQLENYIMRNPAFLEALRPLAIDPLAPQIIKSMMKAAILAEVGPMAAVAGAVAEYVGKGLLESGTDEVMVENGGDVFLQRDGNCRVGIFAGGSPLSNRVGLQINAEDMPVGVCTSSATVGHSLSLGQADAVTVVASSVSLADAAATRIGNEVKADRSIEQALAVASGIEGLAGVVIIRGDDLGGWGRIELVEMA